MGWLTGVYFPAGTMVEFFLFTIASIPVSYRMDTGGFYAGCKAAGT